jgi:hypothetical protein
MNKIISFIIGFGLVMLALKSVDYYQRRQNDAKIIALTQSEADNRIVCASNKLESRLECMKPRLEKIKKDSVSPLYSLKVEDQKEELAVEDSGYFFKIRRTSSMFLGGNCINNFFYFDFDKQYLYFSKENDSGILFCRSGNKKMILYPSQFSEDRLTSEIKRLTPVF